ncbi:WD repeat-containing protein 81-like isoform X2 [Mizuhopecten yessoensis]|uniref:WD repeat-containing protein 81-like isoform X2 n=1 Tax=Mizuhopecten yessoensis TaxID=6573 RepID=UPI000B459FC6|nr:WD repeat-containing protein 81-like isoform X2 [Mizuhopecten yessoensis]
MEPRDEISRALNIPREYTRRISKTRVVCLVSDDWLQLAVQGNVDGHKWGRLLMVPECERLLAPSTGTIQQPWLRISVKSIPKSDQLIDWPQDEPLYNPEFDASLLGHLSETSKENFQNLWRSAYERYHGGEGSKVTHKQTQFTEAVRQYLLRIHPQAFNTLDKNKNHQVAPITERSIATSAFLQNVVPILTIVETEVYFHLIQPYFAQSLHDVVTFSPSIFESSFSKPLFVLYQVLQSMRMFHKHGLSAGNLNMRNILIDHKLWVYVSSVPVRSISLSVESGGSQDSDTLDAHENQMTNVANQSGDLAPMGLTLQRLRSESDTMVEDAQRYLQSSQNFKFEIKYLPDFLEQWVNRKISNFRYLMVLNSLAGRRTGDPNHHPVLPWVMDFSGPDYGFRDLKKSKYRLNKGDNQLDLTYEAFSGLSDDSHIPHHVSDVLSDITFYVYKARRTPKSILCTHVRPRWVPNEYPSSMQRMQEWTPDECIPEFFTDPTIFTSMHEDLPDLELPPWCTTAEDFISKHMEVLESEQVSSALHHWIDLTFGYKLTGSAAVKSKNVNLQLVDEHKNVTNRGVVQLFNVPHPHRIPVSQRTANQPPRLPKNMLPSQMLGDSVEETNYSDKRSSGTSQTVNVQRPELATIRLPKSYDPVSELDQLESLYSFSSHTMRELPHSTHVKPLPSPMDCYPSVLTHDMQAFGCLLCEMFLASSLHMQPTQTSLSQRYDAVKSTFREGQNIFPRPLLKAVETLLQINDFNSGHDKGEVTQYGFSYPIVNKLGLPPPTPVQLLHPVLNMLPFPKYFPDLYTCLCRLKVKDSDIEQIRWSSNYPSYEKQKVIKIIAREKVKILQNFLETFQGHLSQEGLELLLPYLEDLFRNDITAIPAAWSLFNLIGQEIGPKETSTRFLQHLVKLFSSDTPSPKLMKIYHKTFLIQMLLRLGLQTFLSNFATLLVEAVAGYKNYVFEELFTDQQESDALDDLVKRRDDEGLTLPPVEEEDRDEDLEMESQFSEFPTESTQDDVDDIDDEIADSISLSEENHNEPDDEDERSEDSLNISADDESDFRSDCEAYGGESAERASIHSISHLIDKSLELQGVADNEGGSLTDRNSSSHDWGTPPLQNNNENDDMAEDAESKNGGSEVKSGMVRSETDEFAHSMSERTAEEVVNISDVSAESIKWLSHRLGSVLTAKFLSRNLLRMLALCYFGEEQLIVLAEADKKFPKSSRLVCGDRNAHKVLECLSFIAQMYGEQVILLQYIPCIVDMVNTAKKRLTQKAESGVISALVLLRHILPLLSDESLMDVLPDTIIRDTLSPVIMLISSTSHNFPGGSMVRSLICHKVIDVVFVIGLRVGFEMTRNLMTGLLIEFFSCFAQVHGNQQQQSQSAAQQESVNQTQPIKSQVSTDDSYCNIRIDCNTNEYTIGTPVSVGNFIPSPSSGLSPGAWHSSRKSLYSLTVTPYDDRDSPEYGTKDKEKTLQDLVDVFSPELAMASYIPFCRIFGSIYMENSLPNDDMIRQLCSQYDGELSPIHSSDSETTSPVQEVSVGLCFPCLAIPVLGIGSNVALLGNRIQLNTSTPQGSDTFKIGPIHRNSRLLRVDPDETRSDQMEHNKRRHLRGNWLAYWEHELGLSERDTMFNFKQIKLQTFEGHSSSIRSLTVLDNENSFVTASKDKTVKLWSIKSYGDGAHKSRCQWTYQQHKKSVFSVAYLESVRLVASCDSTVHIWDPFTGDVVRRLESTRYSPVTALIPCPSPSTMIITATNDSTLRFLDLRAASYAHEYKCTTSTAGLIRCVTVSPDSHWVCVGFSSGILSLLDLRTGIMMKSWKGHEGDILQMKAYNKTTFLTSSFDQTMKIWNTEDTKDLPCLKGQSEPVHCMSLYKNQIISGTTGNKIGVHASIENQGSFTVTKLKADTFKGVLTSMAILPMNRTVLLGADNGSVRLLC